MSDPARFLRPAGGGIFTVSTGRSEQEALQRKLYGARDADEVQRKWQAALAQVEHACVVVLGNPPFSYLSENESPWIKGLIRGEGGARGYLEFDGERLGSMLRAE